MDNQSIKIEFKCSGRDSKQKEILGKSDILVVAGAQITFREMCRGDLWITITINCPYNCGGHGDCCSLGEKCSPSRGQGVCPYSVDLPYAIDNFMELISENSETINTLEKANELLEKKSRKAKKR